MEPEILICPVCGGPKEMMLDFPKPGGIGMLPRKVPIRCACECAAEEAEAAADRKHQFDARMRELQDRYSLTDGSYACCTFSRDEGKTTSVSKITRRYVEQWAKMRSENIGLLFYGTPGTGKSFYAGAIVNALLERQVPALMTSLPRLLNILQGSRERQQYIDALRSYELLVLDDLGAERESQYAAEQAYNMIDARARVKLPLIVTTNLSIEELKDPPTMQAARIYDRILELCPIPLKMTGVSRRRQEAERKRMRAKELLLDGEPASHTGQSNNRSGAAP